MKKQLLLLLFLSITYLNLNAQCNVPFPPALTCADAPVICDLDGYCSTTSGQPNAIDQPSTFCGLIQNNQWFAFVAGSSNISLEITLGTCQGTAGTGIQAQIYAECGVPWTPASNCIYQVSPASSDIFTMQGLTIGNIYYIMIDGFSGDICDYTIEVMGGSTTAPTPDPAGPILGDTQYCPGATIEYCIPPVFGAAFYDWTIPVGAVIVGPENEECISIDFSGAAIGGGTITVTPNNGCQMGAPNSITVTEGPPLTGPPVFLTICPGHSGVIYGNTLYTAAGTFLNVDQMNSQGCVIETVVVVNLAPNITVNLTEVICAGETSTTGETTTGVFTYNYIATINGCDSTVILDLIVLNPISAILPVTGTIDGSGNLVEIQAVVNNLDPSISYLWTGPCIESNTPYGPTIEVSCAGVYELQLSQTVGGVTCNSPIYSVMVNESTGGNCPDDINGFTTLGEFGNSKYYLSNDVSQPVEAQAIAESVGGFLVSISSQEENDFIQQNISDMAYIGLNDFDSEGDLVWENGEPFSFNNINPCGFCNENSAEQDFVVMQPWDGAWSFSNISNSRKYIMEIPCGSTPPSDITINCLLDFTVDLANGETSIEVDFPSPSASTTCPGGIVTVVQISGSPSGTALEEGTYPITFEATDTCGNVISCTLIITVEPEMISGNCPDDIAGFTTLGEYGDSKYYLSNDEERAVDAQAIAETYDGYLAAISSQEENNFIQQNISDMVYIGLNDADSEGDLEWFNGETFTFNNINPCGFCNENSDDQDFAIMAPWDGAWSFSNFYNSRKYVMEIPCGGTTGGSSITVNCPTDETIILPTGEIQGAVDYNSVTATTTCPTGGLMITLTNGPEVGEVRPAGTYIVIYTITDDCGNFVQCQFEVNIIEDSGVSCPNNINGFAYLGEFENSAYFLSDDIARATDAQVEAASNGGNLAVINSQEENDFIWNQIDEMVYIGLNDFQVEGTMEWVDGSVVDFTNFDICNFCNENTEEMDFAMMHSWNGAWSWSNFYNSRKYIMEVPCTSTLTNPDIGNSFASQISNEIGKPSLENLIPNPAMDFIFVKINTAQEVAVEIMIFDGRGVLVKTQNATLYKGMNSSKVDVSDLPNGFYSVFIPQAEMKFATKRFVKVGE